LAFLFDCDSFHRRKESRSDRPFHLQGRLLDGRWSNDSLNQFEADGNQEDISSDKTDRAVCGAGWEGVTPEDKG
jgi:hypothetical protein